ncbi:MAG: alpha/beta hydrolase [Cyclobacteriaceae bacterium]|nr:alpha/beta hydrolase [Cyclobacteriaceae bacterium]
MPSVDHPDGHSLYYRKTGNGGPVVLWFHGFGQHHQAFDKILKPREENYTHYTFDLFFHGNSSRAGAEPIEKKDWQELFQLFLNETGIQHFNIVAFSIGCRFALATVHSFADRVQNLVMIAPDGIQSRFWYALATYLYLSRKLFWLIVTRPALWNRLLSVLEATHLIDRKLLRFAQRQMDSQSKRERVYNSWVQFRHLKSSAAQLTRLVNSNPLRIILIAGTRDKIVPAKLVKRLTKQIPQVRFYELNANHNELISMSGDHVFEVLNNQ